MNTALLILFFLCCLFSSFDKFLYIDFPFRLRIFYLFAGAYVALTFSKILISGRLYINPFIGLLIVFALIEFGFSSQSTVKFKSIPYSLWLIANTLFAFSVLQNARDSDFVGYYRVFILSYFPICVFGIFQFIAGLIGFGNFFLISVFWENTVPRVNGFTFEASFHALYVLMGYVAITTADRKNHGFEKSTILCLELLMILNIFLTSSRFGIAALWLFLFFRYSNLTLNFFKFRIPVAQSNFLLISICFALLLAIAIFTLGGSRWFFVLLSGVGLFGAATHSISTRMQSASDTLEVFLSDPFRGWGLGGVSGQIMAKNADEQIATVEVLERYESSTVIFEISAATGVLGLIVFLAALGFSFVTLRNSAPGSLTRAIHLSFLLAVLYLQTTQNMLRPYFWILTALAIVSSSQFFDKNAQQLTNKRASYEEK